MRSAIIAAAFVAGALAVPLQKRDVVTDVDVVYVTNVVTVTNGAPTSTAAAESTSTSTSTTAVLKAAHYGHHSYHFSADTSSTSSSEVASIETTTSSSSEAAPTTSSTSEYVAPKPSSTSTSTSTSEYVAPSSTSVYVAPKPTSTSTSSAYIAPKPTSTSTSVYVAPKPTSTSTSSSVWVAPTTYAAPSSTSVAASQPTGYQDTAIYHHNIHRANHSAPDIAWDEGLASTAATIASSCVYAHDTSTNGGGYGQNIAAGVTPDKISAVITDMFYNGEVSWFDGLYGAANPDMTNFEHWGHFSQIVWKASTHVGCATQYCSGGLANVGSDVSPYFTVCNYKGPGNFGGEYGDNIGQSLNQATVNA